MPSRPCSNLTRAAPLLALHSRSCFSLARIARLLELFARSCCHVTSVALPRVFNGSLRWLISSFLSTLRISVAPSASSWFSRHPCVFHRRLGGAHCFARQPIVLNFSQMSHSHTSLLLSGHLCYYLTRAILTFSYRLSLTSYSSTMSDPSSAICQTTSYGADDMATEFGCVMLAPDSERTCN